MMARHKFLLVLALMGGLLAMPTHGALNLSQSPMFVTDVLAPNVLITTPYEHPHNELFIRTSSTSWGEMLKLNYLNQLYEDSLAYRNKLDDLGYYVSEYNNSNTDFLTYGTWYDRVGLVFPWPASNNATCTGYNSSASIPCTPIDIYGDGAQTNLLSSSMAVKQRYVLAPPESNGAGSAVPPVSTSTVDKCEQSNLTDVSISCYYSTHRLTRSFRNTLYFNFGAYSLYNKWPSLGGYTFSNQTMSSALHNPMNATAGARDLTANVSGYGHVPYGAGVTSDSGSTGGYNMNGLYKFDYSPTNKSGPKHYHYKSSSDNTCTGSAETTKEWRARNYALCDGTTTGIALSDSTFESKYPNWYTYWRSSSLASKGIAGSVLQGLVDRGLHYRFRLGAVLPYKSGRSNSPDGVVVHVAQDSAGSTTNLNALAKEIYEATGPLGFYTTSPSFKVYADEYFASEAPYRDNPLDSSSTVRSCRRNFEILVFPDFSTVDWSEKIVPNTSLRSTLTTVYGNADTFQCTHSGGVASCNSSYNSCSYTDHYNRTVLCPQPDKQATSGTTLDPNSPSASFADLAMYGWKSDFRSDLENNILPSSRDPAYWQHISRYIIAPAGRGQVDNSSYSTTAITNWPLIRGDYFPLYSTYDDLYHMALNSRGNYSQYNTSVDAVEVTIRNFLEILTRNSTGSAVATNTTAFSSTTTIYQGSLDNEWAGHMRAYKLTIANNTATIDPTPLWDGAANISAQTSSSTNAGSYADTRRIITVNPDTKLAIPFQWGHLGSTLKAKLRENVNANYAQHILNYLRGNRACEETTSCGTYNDMSVIPHVTKTLEFRKRGLEINDKTAWSTSRLDGRNALGDIANSSPWHVGAVMAGRSDIDFPGWNAYQSHEDQVNRKSVIYVGANDGMLHAFDATTCTSVSDCTSEGAGTELFAYIPSFVFDNLPTLSDKDYNHSYFVDGSPFGGDVFMGGTTGSWKTILVGGANRGGKGYYALDVTTPVTSSLSESDVAAKFMWEFTSADDSDLAYTFNTPVIDNSIGQPKQLVRTNYCTDSTNKRTCKWALIVGNGYPETDFNSAALYIIFLDGPTGGSRTWTSGTDYIKIRVGDTDYSGDGGLTTNGLSSPNPLDIDQDGSVDYVFAGDLNGNLWKFDLTSDTPANWTASYKDGGTATPLFTAKDASGNRQPITTPPEITIHPSTGRPIVLFGTGKFLESTDRTSTSSQSFYGVLDYRSYTGVVDEAPATLLIDPLTRDKLKNRPSTSASATVSGVTLEYRYMTDTTSFSYCTNSDPSLCTQDNRTASDRRYFGWYWDMPTSGERFTGRPQLFRGDIRFNTYIPDTDVCKYGGTGWEMCLDPQTGIQSCLKSGVTLDDNLKYQGLSLLGGFKIGAALSGMTYIPTTDGNYIVVGNVMGWDNQGTSKVTESAPSAQNKGRVSWYELGIE